jgi:CHAT domain-containing protein
MGDYPKALNYLKKSLAIREKVLGKEHTSTATSYNNIGSIYESMGDYPKALNYYKKDLAIVEKVLGKNHTDTATSYNNIGLLYESKKQYDKAYKYAKKSYDTFIINRDKNFAILDNKQKKFYLKANSNKIPLLLNTAYLYGKQSLTPLNISDWIKGSVDDTNATSKSKEDKKKKDTKKRVLNQTTLNDWLNYKGSIYDSENAMITLYENTHDKALKKKIDTLMDLKRKLANLYQTLPKTPQERKSYQQQIQKILSSIAEMETFIASKASSFKEELGLKNINYKDISKNLKKDELYIDYAKAGKYYYIFTLDSENHITFTQIDKKDTKLIDENIKAFRKDIDTILNSSILSKDDLAKLEQSSKKKLSKLYSLLLEKHLQKNLSVYSNLIISTDGALRLLPFETLFHTKTSKYLIEEKTIRYIPSGKELVRLYRHTSKPSKEEVVFFDNPNFDTQETSTLAQVDTLDIPSVTQNRAGIIKSLFKMHFVALPGTKQEVLNIKQTLNIKQIKEYTQSDAKEDNLLKIKNPKILHIATHGFFINDSSIPNPMLKSGIALSGANASAILGKSDGIVTSLKLSGLNLKGTQLVVLSACQTGVVDINSTNSVSGLNKAFIQAGAKNIVMSLWSVADKQTVELMSEFYRKINHTQNYAQALRDAKLQMIQKGLHPFYWGAFILSGVSDIEGS